MIQMYIKEKQLFTFGLLPENLQRICDGKPAFMRLRDISADAPDWTISVSYQQEVRPPNEEKHIALCFHADALDKFKQRRIWEIPLAETAPQIPFSLTLLYIEDADEFAAKLVESGIKIEHFRDLRGRTVN